MYAQSDLREEEKSCPIWGLPHRRNPALDAYSEVIEVEVKAYVRRIDQYDRLHLIANNSRFLILPEHHHRNLASRVLALCEPGETSTETVYGLTSHTPQTADAALVLAFNRGHYWRSREPGAGGWYDFRLLEGTEVQR